MNPVSIAYFESQSHRKLSQQIKETRFFRFLHIIRTVGTAFSPAREHALQRVFERLPEVSIEVRVDQWIQHRIEISDPEQDNHHDVRTGARLAA